MIALAILPFLPIFNPVIQIIRTDSANKDFIYLVKFLDAYLAEKDGDEHSFYAQYNKLDALNHVVLVYENKISLGCGAFKEYNSTSVEVKRMYTIPESRGKGIASKVLTELENWAKELGFLKIVLETGKRQVEAVSFYQKSGYGLIPNYGQYEGMENSLCFEKEL